MSHFITQYQSANLSDEQVIENFVVRTQEFERVMADIRTTPKGTSFQHYVFVGRRGSGKSTLLRRIQAEIQTDKELDQRFLVTNLSEEQAGVYKLYDLWDYVIRDLKAKGLEQPEPNWEDFQNDLKEYSKALYAEIHSFLEKEGKQLVLLIDNIDRIFKNIGKDANLLREQLMNHNDVRIIGGSTIMAEEFWRYDMPFYQFFSFKRLEPVTMEEIQMLLEHWAEVKGNPEIAEFVAQHPGKIHAVRMLTDGTPRTMQLFVDMLIDRASEKGFDYLLRIIDNATPIYRERLGQLSQQQQKIVVELSLFWEAASVEQLVPVCKMSGKNISAQMNQLIKQQTVTGIKSESKNKLYRLTDRFFSMWLMLTQGGQEAIRKANEIFSTIETYYDSKALGILPIQGDSKTGGKFPFSAPTNSQSKPRKNYIDRSQILHASDSSATYNEGYIERINNPFMPTSHWKDPQEYALQLYLSNKQSPEALKKIRKALENYPQSPSILALQKIIQLWSGKMDDYSLGISEFIQMLYSKNKSTFHCFLLELLTHKQYETVRNAILQLKKDSIISSTQMLYESLIRHLEGIHLAEQLRLPPELQETIKQLAARVKQRQEFYYHTLH